MRTTADLPAKAIALLSLCCCAACSPDVADLEALVTAQPAEVVGPTQAAEASSAPFAYRSTAKRSPFAPAVQRAAPPSVGPRHGPLADTPLDDVRLVGTLAGQGERYGLFQSADGTVHRVAVGDPLGTDGGIVDSVSETAVQLTETVRDGAGGWTNRSRTLAMANESNADA